MIELVNLTDWKKQKEIIDELYQNGIVTTSRSWRIAVEKWNKKFTDGEVDYYITHSNAKGFKATKDYQEAKIGRDDYIKRAIDMLKKSRACDKAFRVKDNFKYNYETGEIE